MLQSAVKQAKSDISDHFAQGYQVEDSGAFEWGVQTGSAYWAGDAGGDKAACAAR